MIDIYHDRKSIKALCIVYVLRVYYVMSKNKE